VSLTGVQIILKSTDGFIAEWKVDYKNRNIFFLWLWF